MNDIRGKFLLEQAKFLLYFVGPAYCFYRSKSESASAAKRGKTKVNARRRRRHEHKNRVC